MFLNGIEIRGISSNPANVRFAVERVLAENPPLRSSAWDRRPPAAEKRLLTEWQEAESNPLPPRDAARYVFGKPDAAKRMLLFLEPTADDSRRVWNNVNEVLAARDDVRLELFLHPISRELNPRFAKSRMDFYPRTTQVTRLLEATSDLGGQAKLADVLTWTYQESPEMSPDELVSDVAAELELSVDDLQAAISSKSLDGINSDLEHAKNAGVTWAPTLVIHGRRAPSASVSSTVIRRMLDASELSANAPTGTE